MTHAGDFLHLLVLLRHSLHSLVLALLEHPGAGSLLDHTENLGWLHVEHLGDLALHDEEVGVVDVELHGLEEVLDILEGRLVAIEKILGHIANSDLELARARVHQLTCRVTVICGVFSKPSGLLERSWLLNTIVTDALVTPAWPLQVSLRQTRLGSPLVDQVHEIVRADLDELAPNWAN